MAGEYIGPSIRVINGNEGRLTPTSVEIPKDESSKWSDLFRALSVLDSRVGRQMGPAVIPIEVGFPVELEELPDDYCSVNIRSLFIDPLLHLPEILIVSVSLNDDNYMIGVCNASWEKDTPKPNKIQYYFTNGHTREDFWDVLELASETIPRMQTNMPERKLD